MTENTYRWDSKDYAQHSGAQQRWAHELLAGLALRGDERVLDIGAGDGKVTAAIADRLPSGFVLGVDSSEAMVRLARKRYGAEAPHLRFEQMDAADLRFEEQFDVIFSNATLHWVRDHRPVLRGIKRALAPEGRVLVQMGGRGNAGAVLEAMNSVLARERWRPYFEGFEFPYGFYDPGEYRPWLAEAGLRPLRLELVSKDMQHEAAESLLGWLRTTWLPYAERVPAGRRGVLFDEVLAQYLKAHPPDPDGVIHVAMVRLTVEAVHA